MYRQKEDSDVFFMQTSPDCDGIATEERQNDMIGGNEKVRYALHAMVCLAGGSCKVRQVSDLARCAGLPRFYLAKVVQHLTRAGLVRSLRGRKGGFSLARPAAEITLLQIIEAVEGRDWLPDCLLGLNPAESLRLCPVHDCWARARAELLAVLDRTRLSDLAQVVNRDLAVTDSQACPGFLRKRKAIA